MASQDRSFSDVLQDIVRHIQDITRSEIRLAKTEFREEAAKAKSASALTGAGALCGIFAVFFALLAIVYALARAVPDWAAALIVASVLAVSAGVTISSGIKRFKQVHPTPDKTIETLKENVEWAKQQTR
jgi:phosphatidylglycerophosphate synthase